MPRTAEYDQKGSYFNWNVLYIIEEIEEIKSYNIQINASLNLSGPEANSPPDLSLWSRRRGEV